MRQWPLYGNNKRPTYGPITNCRLPILDNNCPFDSEKPRLMRITAYCVNIVPVELGGLSLNASAISIIVAYQ